MFKWLFGTYIGHDRVKAAELIINDLWKQGYGECHSVDYKVYRGSGSFSIKLVAKNLKLLSHKEYEIEYIITEYGFLKAISIEEIYV